MYVIFILWLFYKLKDWG